MTMGTVADWVMVGITLFGTVAALITLRLLWAQTNIAKDSASSAKATAEAVLLAERAYISMSHHPPGLEVSPPSVDGSVVVRCSVAVENKGNTPARIANAEVTAFTSVNPLPQKPPYEQSITTTAGYLVKNESVNVSGQFVFNAATWAEIQAGTRTLWLLGLVDYTDVFDRRHRAGYARRYDPNGPPANNLPFETQDGYNYDVMVGRM